ncbi:hypothetical protein [Nostoc sp.]
MPHDASRLKSGNPPTALAPQCPTPEFCSQALIVYSRNKSN